MYYIFYRQVALIDAGDYATLGKEGVQVFRLTDGGIEELIEENIIDVEARPIDSDEIED